MTADGLTLLLDDGTGSFPYDISQYAMFEAGYSFNRGRQDWQGSVTPAQLTLTLNNSTGRFTPGSTLIASPSPIRVDQRIRLKETVNGVTYTLFTGYVKAWPVAWPATVVTHARTTITAYDAQARAERWQLLPTWLGNEYVANQVYDYWPMSDPTGSTAATNITQPTRPLVTRGSGAAVSFGQTGTPGSASSTAASFSGAKYLSLEPNALVLMFPLFANASIWTVTFSTSSSGSIASLFGSDSANAPLIGIDATGHLYTSLAGGLASASTVNDGAGHTASIVLTNGGGTNVRLYLDGVLVASGADGGGVSMYYTVGRGFTGLIAHVGTNDATFAQYPTQVARYAQAFSSQFSGDTTAQRIARIAGYIAMTTGTIDTGLTTVPAQDITSFAWPLMQEDSDAEGGTAYVNASGTLDFHNRNRVPLKTTPDLTLAAQWVTPETSPVDDDQQILNYVEATSSVTGVTQVVRNTTSELGNGTATNPGHGRYSDSKTYLVSTDAEALARGNWLVAKFAEPTTRYGTLTINLFGMSASQRSTVLAAVDINCWLRVTGLASQNTGGTTIDVVIQGFTQQRNWDSWSITCNVQARSLYNAWILGDTTYGVLGTTTIAYY